MSLSSVPAVEPVVVDQRREAVLAAVPDVPDERPVLEQLAVLLEELVAKPGVEILLLRARRLQAARAATRRRPGRSDRRERGAPAAAPPPARSPSTDGRHTMPSRSASSSGRPTRAARASGSRAADPPRPAAAPSTTSGRPSNSHCVGSSDHGSGKPSGPSSATLRQCSTSNGTLTRVAVRDLQRSVDRRTSVAILARRCRNAQMRGRSARVARHDHGRDVCRRARPCRASPEASPISATATPCLPHAPIALDLRDWALLGESSSALAVLPAARPARGRHTAPSRSALL